MDCTLLVVCFAALVLPSLQFDDGKLDFKNSRLSRTFDNLKRSGASIRGNLEFVGPLGGTFEANLDGALGRIGNLFNAETRGHLRAGVRSRGLFGKVRGTAGSIEGVLRRSPGALGADLSGRLDNVHGNIFTGVHRNGVRGDISIGSASSRGFPFDSAYTSGLIGRALARRCTAVPRSCLSVRPADRRAVRQFTFDERRNRCVEDFVSRSCARQGSRNNIFPTRRECRRECSSD